MALTAKKVYAILNGKVQQVSDQVSGIATPLIFKGTVATAEMLPTNPKIGWMYNIEKKSIYGEAGMNVAWTGTIWDAMGATIDMSLYLTANDAKSQYQPLEKKVVKTATDTSIILESDKFFVFPEMATLTVAGSDGHFRFTSGETATQLTLPDSVHSDLAIESNRVYEVSILDSYLAWTSWAV